jgi:hypothetical protein
VSFYFLWSRLRFKALVKSRHRSTMCMLTPVALFMPKLLVLHDRFLVAK